MNTNRTRQITSLALLFGAVVFGMILAGNLELTTPSVAQSNNGAIRVASNTGAAAGLPNFADLAEAVDPAVVSVTSDTIETVEQRGNDPFEFFFGPRRRQQDPRNPREEPEERRRSSGGTGFVISADGLIVTNNHVVDGADKVKVLVNGREYEAEIKGTDSVTDLALLQIEPTETLEYLALGDSESVRPGDWVMAIGDPLGLPKTVTVGVVSAKGRSIGISQDTSFEDFIQTDAAINFGNSGGPLLNLDGQVVGINTAINFGAENIGFAVPVNVLKGVLPQLRDKGKVTRGYLGVSISDLDFDTASAFGLDEPTGVLVNTVNEDTPAAKAGLQHGDILLQVDGRKVETTRDLIDYVSALGPDETVSLEVLRNGKMITKKVDLAERPGTGTEAEAEAEAEPSGLDWLGLRYQDITPGLREMYSIPETLEGIRVLDVEATSPLYEENVRPGHLITEINGQKTPNVETFESVIEAVPSGGFLRMYVTIIDPRSGESVSRFAITRKP